MELFRQLKYLVPTNTHHRHNGFSKLTKRCCGVLTFFTILLSVQMGHAQMHDAITCHAHHELSEKERIELSRRFRAWKVVSRGLDTVASEPRTVPVVFHVLSNTSPSLTSFETAIQQLNDAFSNEGSFATEAGIDTKIRFCLAQTTPDGGRTSGVNHVPSAYRAHDIDLETDQVFRRTYWDTQRYLNIYLVDVINGESAATYSGRTWWQRFGVGGYATNWGIAVTSLSGGLLAHECGHYFGLLHTFEGLDCRNDDCLVDGDMVCDTPPDRSVFEPCGDNSCQTDTLSNFSNGFFPRDTVDMSTNIMDYSPCPTDFTLGQAERMHFTLDQSYPTLASTTVPHPLCQAPCDADIAASFDIGNEYPIPGESVTFESEVTSADSVFDYRWYVQSAAELWTGADTTAQVGNTEDLTFAFTAEGVYRVTLHVRRTADPDCFASFAANVIVTCGVDARFYPDKRVIASKQPHALMTDSVTFTNRSHGGTSWEWTVQHRNFSGANPSLPDTLFSDRDLTFYFREPGEYSVRLVATEGTCIDASNTFTFDVLDPTIDGAPAISGLACSGDELTVTYSISNFGYDTINAGTPVAFYDADPSENADAELLRATVLPTLVYGFEQEEFVTRLPTNAVTIPELFIVFNDTGTVDLPLSFPPDDQDRLSTQTVFPPSGYSELTYDNNIASYAINVSLEVDVAACEGDILELDSRELFDPLWCWDSITWVSQNQELLGTENVVTYTAIDDDLIEVIFQHDSGVVSTGRLTVLINDPADQVNVPDTVYRINKGESTRLNVSQEPGYAYEWTPSEGLSDPFVASPRAGPEENTRYTVLVTDPEGCTASFDIQVWVETTAYLPNLFTPNQDGANDRLLAYDLQGVREMTFRIFNRNGAQVFSSDNASGLRTTGWDGNTGGAPQPSGTYFWELQGSYEDGRSLRFNGDKSGVVHLVR